MSTNENTKHIKDLDYTFIDDFAVDIERHTHNEEAGWQAGEITEQIAHALAAEVHACATVEALNDLYGSWHDILHDSRVLANFDAWIEDPDRRILFDVFCRPVYDEWHVLAERADATLIHPENAAAFARPNCPETVTDHLGHCAFCRMNRRLVMGRLRQRRAGSDKLLFGDQIIRQMVDCHLSAAFREVLKPGLSERTGADFLRRIKVAETPKLTLELGNANETAEARIMNAVFCSHSENLNDCEANVNLTWRRVPLPGASAEIEIDEQWAFPTSDHEDSVARVRFNAAGRATIPLHLPKSTANSAVVLRAVAVLNSVRPRLSRSHQQETRILRDHQLAAGSQRPGEQQAQNNLPDDPCEVMELMVID